MKKNQKTQNVSPEKEQTGKEMSITKEQAKYWYSVAKKDISEGQANQGDSCRSMQEAEEIK